MIPIDWNAAVNVMRDALPPTQFKNWVEPLRVLTCEQDRIVIAVPNKFHEDWIRNNYASHISHALEETCGRQLCLEFEVSEENVEAASIPPEFIVSEAKLTPRPVLRVVTPEESALAPAPNCPKSKHPFFELESNAFALQCANHFVQGDGFALNPLVIEAGVGLGKTHLLVHVAHSIYEKNRKSRIHYTTAESFRCELYQSYQANTHREFRRKYWESIDVLIIDDAHMMPKKDRTQEELLHAFNEVTARNGRVVFGTSSSFSKLEGISAPLRSRLMSGMTAEIRTPSFDDRTRLLAQMALHQELELDDFTLRSLAEKGRDNRDLISTLMRVHLHAQLARRPLDSSYLAEIGFAIESKKEALTLDEIVAVVEHNFGVSREDLSSKCRKSNINWARQVAMYLARWYTHLSMEAIGQFFGRDHATVVHAYQKVTEAMESHPTRRYEVQHLKSKLQGRAPRNHVPF